MKKIIHGFATVVILEADEAKTVCKLGEGSGCCAFLVVDSNGFECILMSYPANGSIFKQLEDGTMNAKGQGGWPGCAWEDDLA